MIQERLDTRETRHKRREEKKVDERDALTEAVIGAAIEVHRVMGPGLLESVYQKCLVREFRLRNIGFNRKPGYQSSTKARPSTMSL
jgi:PD-(D/E)XK nuclease superfamily